MDDTPLVSAIVIFLNEEKFLKEAIDSVLAQTYSYWELLLVDDGSTDGSRDIARQYADQYPAKIRYLEHEGHLNRGMSPSRNLGIRHATGEYIGFLDADDVWLPHKLQMQVDILNARREAALVYGASQYWLSWTGNELDCDKDFTPKLGVEANRFVPPPTLLTLSLRSLARTPCPSDFLIRRHIVEEVGGFEERFSGHYQLFEDQAFLAKVFLRAPVFVTHECWDRYRRHPESCVSVAAQNGKKHFAGLFYLSWLEGYLSARGIRHSELWKALREKQFRYRHPTVHRLLRDAHGRFRGLTETMRVFAERIFTSLRRSLRIP